MMRHSSLQFVVTAVVSVFLSLGCGRSGPELATVTGTVTLNGEPVSGVRVTFVPEDQGSPSYGATGPDGVYRLLFNQSRAGAELGTHHVLIESAEPETYDSGKPIDSAPIVKVPAKYRQPGALTADVYSGRNEFDFDLETESTQANLNGSGSGTRTASR